MLNHLWTISLIVALLLLPLHAQAQSDYEVDNSSNTIGDLGNSDAFKQLQEAAEDGEDAVEAPIEEEAHDEASENFDDSGADDED